jgi:hypothetical protein
VRVLSRVFRGKFVAGLKKLFRKNKLRFFGACKRLSDPKEFAAFTRTLFRDEWVVYAKRQFGEPEHVCITWPAIRIAWRSPTITS